MIRDDILRRRGVCVIDPHGTLYESLVKWIAMHDLHHDRNVHLIDPSLGEWTTGINPLRLVDGDRISTRADAVRDAFAHVWGNEDTSRTPLLRKCLRAVIHVLIVHKLTLLEAMELVTAADTNDVRKYLTNELEDYIHQRLWSEFNAYEKRLFNEEFRSTVNRFIEFLDSPEIRTIIGSNLQPINLRSCMRNGDIVLVNLRPGTISFDNARLIGTLITSDLFAYAFDRDKAEARNTPFYVYIDECSRFVTESVVRALDETAKFGLHFVLSHQRLGQLRREDENLYNAIMAGAQTKVFFGCNEDDDAEIMSRHLFRQSFDLERPVANMIKPTPVGQERVLLGGVTQTQSRVDGGGESIVENAGTIIGLAEQMSAVDGSLIGVVHNQGESSGSAHAQTSFWADGWAKAIQQSESLGTVYKDLPTENWSIERWIHEGIVKMRGLATRKAIVQTPGQKSVEITTPFIRDPIATAVTAADATKAILLKSPYAVLRDEINEELRDRHTTLQTAVDRWKNRGREQLTYDDDEF